MYENSEADGNIDKAAVSVSPDGARRVVSPPSPAHVSFGHCWNEQIAESESFIWAVGTDFGNVKEAMKDPRPNAHLQHDWLPAWKSTPGRLAMLSSQFSTKLFFFSWPTETWESPNITSLCFFGDLYALAFCSLWKQALHFKHKILSSGYLHGDVTSSLHWQGSPL